MIPPRPAVLVDVLAEQARGEEADLGRVVDLIGSDVALSAATLRVVNSAFYGLARKMSSIDRAVRYIGLDNLATLVTGVMLQTAFSGWGGAFMDAFWQDSRRLATTAARVARACGALPPDEAYTLGLFADCGVPLMLRRFPEYADFYPEAHARPDAPFSDLEDDRFGTAHTAVGFMLARAWQLPPAFCQCVLRHHDDADYFTEARLGPETTHLAVLQVALHVHRGRQGLPLRFEYARHGAAARAYLGMGEDDVAALVAEGTAADGGASA